jgi:hypothetical protein
MAELRARRTPTRPASTTQTSGGSQKPSMPVTRTRFTPAAAAERDDGALRADTPGSSIAAPIEARSPARRWRAPGAEHARHGRRAEDGGERRECDRDVAVPAAPDAQQQERHEDRLELHDLDDREGQGSCDARDSSYDANGASAISRKQSLLRMRCRGAPPSAAHGIAADVRAASSSETSGRPRRDHSRVGGDVFADAMRPRSFCDLLQREISKVRALARAARIVDLRMDAAWSNVVRVVTKVRHIGGEGLAGVGDTAARSRTSSADSPGSARVGQGGSPARRASFEIVRRCACANTSYRADAPPPAFAARPVRASREGRTGASADRAVG